MSVAVGTLVLTAVARHLLGRVDTLESRERWDWFLPRSTDFTLGQRWIRR